MGKERSGNAWNEALASVLKEMKKERHLTFEDLMAATDIPIRSLKRIINDERAMNNDDLQTVAVALGSTSSEVVAQALPRLK